MKTKKPKIKKLKKKNVKIDGALHARMKQHVKGEGGIVEIFVERAIEQRLAHIDVVSRTHSAAG